MESLNLYLNSDSFFAFSFISFCIFYNLTQYNESLNDTKRPASL
jgi:hypothetical protein